MIVCSHVICCVRTTRFHLLCLSLRATLLQPLVACLQLCPTPCSILSFNAYIRTYGIFLRFTLVQSCAPRLTAKLHVAGRRASSYRWHGSTAAAGCQGGRANVMLLSAHLCVQQAKYVLPNRTQASSQAASLAAIMVGQRLCPTELSACCMPAMPNAAASIAAQSSPVAYYGQCVSNEGSCSACVARASTTCARGLRASA